MKYGNLVDLKEISRVGCYLKELKEINEKYGNDIPILTCCFFHYNRDSQHLEEQLSLRPMEVRHKDTSKILPNCVYDDTIDRFGKWDRASTHIAIERKLETDFDIDGTVFTLKGESARTAEYIRNRVEQERLVRGEDSPLEFNNGYEDNVLRFLCVYQPEHEDMIPICIDGYSMKGVEINMDRMLSLLKGYLNTVERIYDREKQKKRI